MKKSILKNSGYAWLIVIAGIFLYSCENDKSDPVIPDEGYTGGFYIVNEGIYLTGTGTIDFVKNNGTVYKDIFSTENDGLPLGNVVQSVCIIGVQTFVVVNNANKVEIVDTKTFKSAGTIDNLPSPRYIIAMDNENALVSCIQDSSVRIVNLNGFEILGSLPVKGPEKMMQINDQIWILSQGGFSVDSIITLIDIASKTIVDTIQVYPQPSGIQEDRNGKVWVMCSGRNAWHTGGNSEGHLICINPADHSIIEDIEFPSIENHPEELMINQTKDVLYYRYPGGIYRFEIEAVEPESSAFIPRSGGFYTLAYDQGHSLILGTDPLDYIQNGWVFRYRSDDGSIVDSIEAGIIPGEIYFVP
jgi:hypothetical protein